MWGQVQLSIKQSLLYAIVKWYISCTLYTNSLPYLRSAQSKKWWAQNWCVWRNTGVGVIFIMIIRHPSWGPTSNIRQKWLGGWALINTRSDFPMPRSGSILLNWWLNKNNILHIQCSELASVEKSKHKRCISFVNIIWNIINHFHNFSIIRSTLESCKHMS